MIVKPVKSQFQNIHACSQTQNLKIYAVKYKEMFFFVLFVSFIINFIVNDNDYKAVYYWLQHSN